MARARTLETSSHDGNEVRGAATAAPHLTPLQLAETAVAAIVGLMRENAGADFSQGAVAVGALLPAENGFTVDALTARGLLADLTDGRVLCLVPLGGEPDTTAADEVLTQLRDAGLDAVASAPRRSYGDVEDALREATILVELLADSMAALKAHEATYRLLIGVWLRSPEELLQLRSSTIAPLRQYDGAHDTELLTTLETFLSNHGSTTDTAEAMGLHRHTVGYRLARVQEVSGLSPYESWGRERLSLGLKAHRIIVADSRRAARVKAS